MNLSEHRVSLTRVHVPNEEREGLVKIKFSKNVALCIRDCGHNEGRQRNSDQLYRLAHLSRRLQSRTHRWRMFLNRNGGELGMWSLTEYRLPQSPCTTRPRSTKSPPADL